MTDLGTRHTQSNPGLSRNRHTEKNRDRSVTLGLTFDNEDQDDRSWHTSYTIKPRPVKKQTHREEQRQICDNGADLRQRGPG